MREKLLAVLALLDSAKSEVMQVLDGLFLPEQGVSWQSLLELAAQDTREALQKIDEARGAK